jgi:glycosyltransferase involved in cell wall biosynthesis
MERVIDGPLISVLTPTWNRAQYLERVWQGLAKQTFTNFEWIVANDGSEDETREVVRKLAGSSKFPVVFIDASEHIGKPRMDNELIKHARGKFVLWNDSDDYLVPEALARLLEVWNFIPAAKRGDYIGLTALCASPDGLVQSSNTPSGEIFDTTWNELIEKYRVHGDKLFFVQTELIKTHRFAEVDFMVTESSFWKDFSDLKTRFIPEVVKIVDRSAPNRISFSGKMEYCRGKAYGIALSDTTEAAGRWSLKTRLWKAITYYRYCVHGELSFRAAKKLWNGNLPHALFASAYPLGWCFALKDRLQGKVRQTHREFDRAARQVTIEVNVLSPTGGCTTRPCVRSLQD